MRKLLLLLTFLVAVFASANSQNLSYSCPRDTILACGNPCLNIVATIPDIRSLGSDYTVSNITPQSQCYPFVDPGGPGPSADLDIDDTYSDVITLPFSFPFYGTNYTSLIISTNGYVSFDVSQSGMFSHWQDRGDLPDVDYDRALIMGPYHDLQPGVTTSPTQKIKYNVVGNAPNRLWVLSFYRVPLFDCNNLFENTHQIILHEASGIIEVFIKDKQICDTWVNGKSMVGLQNFARNLGITAPGRKESDAPWGSIGMNETWRFIPKNGPTTYRSTQLLDGAGTVVATGDTTRVNANTFSVTFPNVCPPANVTSTYVVKTTYVHVLNPATTYYSLDTIFVTRQNSLPIDTATTQTDCGGSTGTITATASGGTPPYQYSINFGPYQSSGLFTGLAQGVYNIVGMDAAGCTDTLQVPITARANIPGTVTQTPTGCPGVNNGTITVTPGGGTAPYTYSLDGGAPGNSNVITGVSAGPHTVVFTDANGCTGVVTTTVGAGSSITSSAPTTVPATCFGANNGSATINPTSGSAPYTYSLNGGTPQTSNVFTGLAGGNYSVLITDAAGCTGTRTFFVNTGSGISLAAPTSTPESCPGAANGTITITTNNGTAPFTYALDGGTPQASNVFTGVSSGFHTVVVRDANNCSATQSLPVSVGTGITATATSSPTACAGASNGSITVTVTPAGGTYTYELDGGTPQGTNIFTGVADGSHTVIVRDAGGCTDTVSVTVTAGSNITATTTTTTTSCPGVDNGEITVTPTNGTAPYQYSIDGTTFQASGTFTGLAAGSYTVTIRDASGCTGTATETVVAGTALNGTATATPSTCTTAANGSVTATVTNGTAPYTYSLDGTTFQASNTFTGLVAGSYTITFQDASGCQGTATATITAGAGFSGSATETPASCPGVDNGSITATPDAAGQAPFTYSLDGGTSQTSGVFNNVAAGAHTVIITDAAGCTASVDITVTANSSISGTASTTNASCPGVANGEVTITPGATATAPFTYSLDGGTAQASASFTGLSSGTHTVIITDANGCSAPVDFTIGVGTPITGSATNPVDASCPGVNNGEITIVPGTTATAPFTFSMDGGASQASGTFTGLSAGAHTATFTDANGCVGTVDFTINAGGLLTGSYTEVQATCSAASNGSLTVTPTAGTGPYLYSLDGGTPQASATFTNLAPGNYTVTFTDGLGCMSDAISATVTAAPALTLTATPVNASCPGVNNGSVTLNPDPLAVAPFTFILDGGTPQSSPAFSGLAAGAHSGTFTDANGCSATVNFTIGANASITGTAQNLVSASCPGVNNGEATIVPGTTATGPFTFSMDGGASQASGLFTGLSAGPHTASITDANGCSVDVDFTITAGGLLNGSYSEVPATCPDATNGSVTITPTSGTGPYLYSLNGGAAQASATFSNLAPGNYTITFTDGLGCLSESISATVTSAPALTLTATPVDASCPGVNNGSVTLNPDPLAVGPFTFSVDGGAGQASPVFTGLAAGSHTATFIDANGCPATVTFNISSGGLLTGSYTEAPATCPDATNGSITVTPTSGSGPYLYSLDGGSPQLSSTFSNLAPGNYTVTFTDGLGCLSESISATVTSAPALSLTATPVDASCPGVNNGSVTLNPDPLAVPPLSFSINGGSSQASPVFTGLAPGSYTATFTDANGCPATVTFSIASGADLTADTISTETSCPGVNNGTITVTPTSGTAPYQFSIDGGTPQGSGTFTNLAPGTYSITFTDAIGCSGTVTETVSEGISISSDVTSVQPVCNDINDGQITVTPTSGVGPYTYSLNGGGAQTSPTFTSLAPGSYNIVVTDGVGCTGTNTATLITNPAITLSATKTDPLCFSAADGSITVTATGGVSPYEYSLDGATTFQPGSVFSGLAQGSYTITVRDNVGCIKMITESLSQPTELTASTVTTPSTCAGGDGTITITAGGGTPNYLYSVDNGASYPFQSSNVFTVGKGNYNNIAVKDDNGCMVILSAVVGEVDVMGPLFIGNDTTVCQGQPVTFDPQVHPQATIFKWRENIYLDSDTIKNATATPEDTTMYILTAQWGACQREDTITVNVLWRPIPDAGLDQRICLNDSTTISGTVSHTSGPVTLVWSPADLVHDDSSATTIAVPGGTQIYTLTATDDYGCNFSVTDSVLIIMQPEVPAFAGGDTLVTVNLPFQLMGSGGVQYLWSTNSPNATIADPTVRMPVITSTSDANFMVQVTDIAGCVGYDTVYVQVYQGPEYYVPNAFSPNGDGLNDVFRAIPVGMTRPEYFRVFNRFGELVFETNQYLKGWDGTYKGKLQPMGAYIWILKGEDRKGRKVEMKGTVMLVQ